MSAPIPAVHLLDMRPGWVTSSKKSGFATFWTLCDLPREARNGTPAGLRRSVEDGVTCVRCLVKHDELLDEGGTP